MIPIVFSSPVPIANEQARQLQAQAQTQPRTTQSPQTATSSSSSQSTPSQGSGPSSAVCFAPCCTTVAEMTGTVTSAAPWVDTTLPSHPPGYSSFVFDPSASSFVSPQPEYQQQANSMPQQPSFGQHYMPPGQQQMFLQTPTSQPAGRHSQPPPNLHGHIYPRPQDNTRRSNTH